MMLFEMCVCFCKREYYHVQAFLHAKNDVVRDALVLVQEGKIARASLSPWWNDVVRDALVLMQDGKLARASFLYVGMMLFEM
jgi:hypothetical protein